MSTGAQEVYKNLPQRSATVLDVVGSFWYKLIYHMDSLRTIAFFSGEFNLVPDFFRHFRGETIANLAMFVPFGILYPLSVKKPSWKGTIITGFICSMVIELLQPIFGRAFDINDIIMNTMGVLLAVTSYFVAKRIIPSKIR